MDHKGSHRNQAKQFDRDDVARISASVVNAVLEQLREHHMVDGIAVLPMGEDVYLVDIVMLDLETRGTWGVSITIPPSRQETEKRD